MKLQSMLFIALITIFAGCVTPPQTIETTEAPDLKDETRRERMIQEFESRRDRSQYEAALSRWEEGSAEEAQKLLESLLERNPHNQDTRRLLAEVHIAQNNFDSAAAHLRQLLDVAPDDAAAWHQLGVVFELSGRIQESQHAFQRALSLDPENALYQLAAVPK